MWQSFTNHSLENSFRRSIIEISGLIEKLTDEPENKNVLLILKSSRTSSKASNFTSKLFFYFLEKCGLIINFKIEYEVRSANKNKLLIPK